MAVLVSDTVSLDSGLSYGLWSDDSLPTLDSRGLGLLWILCESDLKANRTDTG